MVKAEELQNIKIKYAEADFNGMRLQKYILVSF